MGCNSKYVIKYNSFSCDSLNNILNGKEVNIIFIDESEISGEIIKMSMDSIFLSVQGKNHSNIYPIHDIKKIINKDKFKGIINGFLFGTGIGTAVLTIYSGVESNNIYSDIFFNIIGSSVSFGLTGAFLGYFGGQLNEYQFVTSIDSVEIKINEENH